jgi:hypothetical protein
MLVFRRFGLGAVAGGVVGFSPLPPSAMLSIAGCSSAIEKYSIESQKVHIRNDRDELELLEGGYRKYNKSEINDGEGG